MTTNRLPEVPSLPELPDSVSAAATVGAKMIIGAVPVLGPFLVAGVEGVENYAASQTLAVWAGDLTAVVEAIAAKVDRTPEELLRDPTWLDAVARATLVAFSSRQEERRRMLANALFSVGTGAAPEDPWLRESFLKLIDEVTPAHMRYLGWISRTDADPPYKPDSGFGTMTAGEILGPSIASEDRFWRMAEVGGELESLGLTRASIGRHAEEGQEALTWAPLSEKGRKFLAFVSGPFDASDAHRARTMQ